MSILQWMDIIYPLNTALFVLFVSLKLLYLLVVRRSMALLDEAMLMLVRGIVVMDALIGLSEVGVHLFLGLSTGESPKFDMNTLRIHVVVSRAAMSMFLVTSIILHVAAISFSYRRRIDGKVDAVH